MVQQISALIVQPAVDPARYTAGANEKVAADKAMVVSGREAGAAVVDTSAKINQAGDVLARLSRQYVEGYASEQRFTQGLNQLDRGLQAGKISMDGAERILIGMNQRLGLTANAAELAAKGQMTLASAVERANVQIARQATELAEAAAASGRFHAANSNTISAGQRQAAGFNAGQQIQDIAMMSILGQAPGTLALQQGPALASAIQQGGGLAALGAGLGSLLSVTTLLTVGFTAATAATIQWFMKGKDGAKSFNEALKAHSDALALLKDQYGELGEASKSVGNAGGIAFTDASARSASAAIQAQLRSKLSPFIDKVGGADGWSNYFFGNGVGAEGLTNLSGDQKQFAGPVTALLDAVRQGNSQDGLRKFRADVDALFSTLAGKSGAPTALRATADAVELLGENAFTVSGKFAPFADSINKLKVAGADGLSTFNAEVEKIGKANGIQAIADEAIIAGKGVVDLAEKAKELEKVLSRLDFMASRPGLVDQRDLRSYVARRDADARILDQQFAADQQLARARTNAERLVAVEAQVRARAREDGDSGGGLQARVDRALTEERGRQQVEARDAAIQRSQALTNSINQQKIELDLIGKTTSQQTALRFEFERMQELREQAARTGEPIDQKEVASIKAAAAAMKEYAGAIGAANDIKSQSENIAQLRLEIDLVGQNASVREKAMAQYETGLRIIDLGIDRYGQLAEMMRANARVSADLTSSLERQAGAWDAISGTATNGIDRLVDSAANGFKNINDALEETGKDLVKTALQLSVGNPLKNWLTGSDLPEMGDLKSMGGALGRLFGMSPEDPASAVASALGGRQTAMMNVSAAVVNISGGIGSDGFGGTVSRLFSGSNDNYAPGAVTRSPLPNIGDASSYSVANATSFIKQYASAIGIDPNVALKVARSEGLGAGIWQSNVIRNGIREPSYGPFQMLKGGAGTGFGTGLGNRFMSATGLDPADPANWQKSTAFALDQAKQNGWGAWYGAKSAGITGFDGIDRSAKNAVGALDKIATSSTMAAQNLNGLGSVVGNVAKSMLASNGFDLSKLMPGSFQANTTLSDYLGYAPSSSSGGGLLGAIFGGLGKLLGFADGTENAPPGWAWVGERGPELMRMRGGEQVRSNARSADMMASYGRAAAPPEINIYPQAGIETKTRKRKNGRGGDVTDIIARAVKQSIADGDMDSTLGGRFGMRPVLTRRGTTA